MKTIYLINHSHTDIGYTHPQEVIMLYHADYIKQVLEIIGELKKNDKLKGFVWTCENYWQIENFKKNATTSDMAKFNTYVEQGFIDFSKSYLNMTELVDYKVLNEFLDRGNKYSKQFKNKRFNSAMTADINGYSWSYADAMLENEICNLFSCVHGHHGIYPTFGNQSPFWWESPKGEKILVWNGEYYHLANELFIMPDAYTSYQVADEYVGDFETQQLEIAEKRITRYISELLENGYEYDFIPLMISGFMSDNAGPNINILEFIESWNKIHGNNIKIEMIGLNRFFEKLRRTNLNNVPTYKGDWNDWWADGVGSTPDATKIYREAVRKLRIINKILPNESNEYVKKLSEAKENLILYSEHTWGYSASVSEPWSSSVKELEARKAAYSIKASEIINFVYNKLLTEHYSMSFPRANREKKFVVLNPHETSLTMNTKLIFEHWENIDGERIRPDIFSRIRVRKLKNNKVIPHQIIGTARGFEIEITLHLDQKERLELIVELSETKNLNTHYISKIRGSEGVIDIKYPELMNHDIIETKYFLITLSNDRGVSSIIYKPNKRELLKSQTEYFFFEGIYEKTEILTDPCQERRRMGRNRRGRHAEKFTSSIREIKRIQEGPVYTEIEIESKLEGTLFFIVKLKFYHQYAKIESSVIFQKKSEWAPESLFVSIPLEMPGEVYFSKSGNMMRPSIDQLPGTNTDFYSLDTGIGSMSKEGFAITVNPKDTPLVMLGELNHHLIELHENHLKLKNSAEINYWLMNNFWETNFKADLSGFYEFKFIVSIHENIESLGDLEMLLNQNNEEILAFPIK